MADISTISSKSLLPKTGQTTSYADYDDGYFEKGSPISPRFVDNGDGTISDRVTGLMWPKDVPHMIVGAAGVNAANTWTNYSGQWLVDTGYFAGQDCCLDGDDTSYWVCVVSHTSAAAGTFADDRTANPTYWRNVSTWLTYAKGAHLIPQYNWADNITRCEALEFAGYTDWRMPNIMEILSIKDASFANGSGNNLYPIFYNLASWGEMFTSTTIKNQTDYAYAVCQGTLDVSTNCLKTYGMGTWPVRGAA